MIRATVAKTRRTKGGDKEDPWTGPYCFANGNILMGPTTSADVREPVLVKRRGKRRAEGLTAVACLYGGVVL